MNKFIKNKIVNIASAAIWEGQARNGSHLGPETIKCANLFEVI